MQIDRQKGWTGLRGVQHDRNRPSPVRGRLHAGLTTTSRPAYGRPHHAHAGPAARAGGARTDAESRLPPDRGAHVNPADQDIQLGFFGANVGGMASPESGEVAALAESLGYRSLWVAEHVVLPKPRADRPPLDPDWPMADPLL